MDFEFGMLDRTNIVLISGAMSNSLDRYRIIKVEEKPLLLTKDRHVKIMGERDVLRSIKEICRIFKGKEEILFPVLKQMQDSKNTKNSNLNIKCIKKYLGKHRRQPVIVFWNGSTDKKIMERLGLGNYHMLEISSYDMLNNKIFKLQLKNKKTKQITVSEEIGHVEKKGRLLNLTETHNQICNKTHTLSYAHDPCTDVAVTKCLFDKLFRICNRRKINNIDYL
ncbi:hypothetical protein AGLY_016484 [Aphis glycines]|uniref:Uncharacterized protein n=1 Tax=Aphis glycines TaxID=307491 RepID=A0A6G0SXL4_APHGL|nr:hypothetical protein AGLY_016484 [Aphis glycines]